MLVLLIIPFLIILLQIFLSKQNNKYLGLILPIFCLLSSFLSSIGAFIFLTAKTSNSIIIADSTEIVESVIHSSTTSSMLTTSSPFLDALTLFAVSNIPTLIFLVIYKNCRNKLAQEVALKKMNISDLE